MQVYQDPDEGHRHRERRWESGEDATSKHPDAAEEVHKSPIPL